MALSESALKMLHKNEILLCIIRVNLILRWQKDLEQLRSDLSITKLVNTKLKEKFVSLQRQHGAIVNTGVLGT